MHSMEATDHIVFVLVRSRPRRLHDLYASAVAGREMRMPTKCGRRKYTASRVVYAFEVVGLPLVS